MKTTNELQRDAGSELFKLLSPQSENWNSGLPIESELAQAAASAENATSARHSSRLMPAR